MLGGTGKSLATAATNHAAPEHAHDEASDRAEPFPESTTVAIPCVSPRVICREIRYRVWRLWALLTIPEDSGKEWTAEDLENAGDVW